ncbi:MAG TPA: hypothetical protein VK735_27550 [Pseudonocardia sp.]|uniref:hypothetical protein n=1 Tax=Pseudonocardia sp. TaxID=60912 RepID=UPI002BC3148C|nr:hypothetical protein [Pseudonocardia sp.]HTF51214.1 hypothetical protein [Pseudonocardia sp.]
MSDRPRSPLPGVLAGTAALLILAAGVTGAVLLRDWRVADLGLVVAVVAYVLASLAAVTVRNLRRPKPPVPTSANLCTVATPREQP